MNDEMRAQAAEQIATAIRRGEWDEGGAEGWADALVDLLPGGSRYWDIVVFERGVGPREETS